MVNENKTPDIRFDSFDSDWETKLLCDLLDFSNGINAPKEKYGKGRKMISVMDILSVNTLSYDGIIGSVEVDTQTESNKKVESGDLVFVRSSEVVTEVGWAKAYNDDEYALFSGFSIRGKKKTEFDNRFVELSMNSRNRKQIELKSGGSTRFNVNQSILSEVKLLVPVLDEQRELGDFFRYLDEVIAHKKQQHEKTKSIKMALLIKMFPQMRGLIPQVRFDGFSDSWTQYKLGELFIERNERSSVGELISVTINSGVLRASNLGRKDNSSDDKSNYKKVEVGDIAYNSMRMWQGASGISLYTGILSPAYTVITPTDKANSLFFSYLFKLPFMIQIFQAASQGMTSDTWNLKFSALKNIEVTCPSYNEQAAIGSFFCNLDVLIESEQQEIEKLQNIKNACLNKMFV